MIRDLRSASTTVAALPPGATAVVGSGAAGLAVALRLEEAGRPVVLVESGGLPSDAGTRAEADALDEGEVAGLPYAGLTGGRARVLGGATQLWHGQCTRLRDLDLAPRPWVAHSGWPLGADELAGWYDRAEDWFGLSRRGYDGDRWAEHPRLSPLPWSPPDLESDFSEYTPTPHLGDVHRRRLERSALVVVLTGATVVRALLEGDACTGVEVATTTGRREVLPARTVVLAAGAVENARLLLLSDPAGVGVGSGRRLTGRYLQDHPVVETLQVRPHDPSWLQDRASPLHRGRRRLYPKVRLSAAVQEREHLLAANAVLVHEHDDPALEAARRVVAAVRERRAPAGGVRDAVLAASAGAGLARTAYRRWARGLSAGRPARRVSLQVWLEQEPDPDSRIVLGSSLDAVGAPVARVDWRVGELERRTSRVMSTLVARDLRESRVADVDELAPMTDDDAWTAAVGDAYHPAGTTRLARSGADGVVDLDGRVHGVAGLHVAGSSVFPVAGFANPTLTIVALSLRLADHLLGRAAR